MAGINPSPKNTIGAYRKRSLFIRFRTARVLTARNGALLSRQSITSFRRLLHGEMPFRKDINKDKKSAQNQTGRRGSPEPTTAHVKQYGISCSKKNRKSIKPLRTSDINCMWQLNVRSIRQSKYPDLDSTPIPAFSIIDQWHKGTAHHHGGHTAEELHLYSIALESFFSIVVISYHPSFQNARKIFQKMKEYAPDFYREHIILSKNLVFTETGQIAS